MERKNAARRRFIRMMASAIEPTAIIETLENRRLLSVSVKILSTFNVNGANGSSPGGGVVADRSGNLYGTTSSGGTNHDGTVYEISAASHKLTTLVTFNGSNGSFPFGSLTMDQPGNLYGTTSGGGTNNDGTIYEITAGTHQFSTLANFNGSNGQNPVAGLTIDRTGDLFGTTSAGGTNQDGVIFAYKPYEKSLTALHSFNGSDGAFLFNDLAIDTSFNLIGTSSSGGSQGDGTLFELTDPFITAPTLRTLVNFNASSGLSPNCGLTFDMAGNLYGTTQLGGTGNNGTIFEIPAGSPNLITLASFAKTNGRMPSYDLTVDSAGNLYGTTSSGGTNGDGTVFKLSAGSHTPTTLLNFNATSGSSDAVLTSDASGNLYGTTLGDNTHNAGTVFELSGSGFVPPIQLPVTTLVNFNNQNGAYPYAGLTSDSAGNLYGATSLGGAHNDGSVFEISAATHKLTTLASLDLAGGRGIFGSVNLDTAGNIYGMSEAGGASGDGTVFEVAAGTHKLTTLVNFNGSNGGNPYGGLIADSAGNFYGMTSSGGASNEGTVFEISAGTHKLTTLVAFNFTDGGQPEYGNLTLDTAGNLYGTTSQGGGGSGDGTVFEISAGSHKLTTLVMFNGADGSGPQAGLTSDAAGNLYGTTGFGGRFDYGTVFELAAGSHKLSTLASFDYRHGATPYCAVTLDAAGNLYGTTYGGGQFDDGTIFKIAAGSHQLTTLVDLSKTQNWDPFDALTADAAGNLFTTTSGGGTNGEGTVIEITGSGFVSPIASKLGFASVPTSGSAGKTLGKIVVDIKNQSGQVIPGNTSKVTITIASGPSGGTLSGTTTVAAFNGVVTFTTLKFSKAGKYTLKATDGSLASVVSAIISVT